MPKKPKKTKISQSLMKNLYDYVIGNMCGKKFEALYMGDANIPPTPAMNLGNWFEFVATGQLPRDGKTPEPKRLKSGKLSIDYVRMESQAENFHNMMKGNGFEIISTGHVFKKNDIATGIADIIARKDGKTCVVDVKTSGLLDDRWHEMGWNLDALDQKDKLLIQAVHYKFLAEEEFGEDVDFYFAVFSTKNEHDCMLIRINVDEDRIQQHITDIYRASQLLEEQIENGFKSTKKHRDCVKCFLKENCEYAINTPEINEVYY